MGTKKPASAKARGPRTGPEAKSAGLIKISEVAERAGVASSTVKYYLSQGLLPEPIKTSRNMAYYPQETVEWVRLIKQLQRESFLPLDAVKKLLEKVEDPSDVQRYFSTHATTGEILGSELTSVSEAQLCEEGQTTPQELRKLVTADIVSSEGRGSKRSYSGEDAAIIRQLVRMRDSGLNPERGFGVQYLSLYRDMLEELVERELQIAMETVVGSVEPAEIQRVAREWVDGTNELISLLHRKLIRRRLEGLAEHLEVPPPTKKSPRRPARRK